MNKTQTIYFFIIIVLTVAFFLPGRQLINPELPEPELVNTVSELAIVEQETPETNNESNIIYTAATTTNQSNTIVIENTAQSFSNSVADNILDDLQSFEPTDEELDELIASAESRYSILIANLNLAEEDEQSLINLIVEVLTKELYLGQLVQNGTISQEAFRRLSTTTEDLSLAMSSFLTEEEMMVYTEFQEGQEQRFLNRWENIMYEQVSTLIPELNELERSIIAAFFVEELDRLRSGEGGVLSNEHLRTAYTRTREWLENEGDLDELDLERIRDFLNAQIRGLAP